MHHIRDITNIRCKLRFTHKIHSTGNIINYHHYHAMIKILTALFMHVKQYYHQNCMKIIGRRICALQIKRYFLPTIAVNKNILNIMIILKIMMLRLNILSGILFHSSPFKLPMLDIACGILAFIIDFNQCLHASRSISCNNSIVAALFMVKKNRRE